MRLRAPVRDELNAVFALMAARDIADIGAPDYTLEDLAEEWDLSEVDLARDVVVAESDATSIAGGIVGYAIVRSVGTLAIVAPDHEGQGIGAQLLAWVERRARERGDERYRQWVAASNERGCALLLRAGYEPVRSYWRFVRPLAGAEPTAVPSPPAGMRLRALDPVADAATLHALHAATFGGNPDYHSESPEAFREEHLGAHDLDWELSRVAERDGTPIGYLLARHWAGEGVTFIDLLGVHPAHRGAGLATALLHSTFSLAAEKGLREVQLGVASDNPGALRLYERCGMTPRFRFDTFERPTRVVT